MCPQYFTTTTAKPVASLYKHDVDTPSTKDTLPPSIIFVEKQNTQP
eukprot:UN01791